MLSKVMKNIVFVMNRNHYRAALIKTFPRAPIAWKIPGLKTTCFVVSAVRPVSVHLKKKPSLRFVDVKWCISIGAGILLHELVGRTTNRQGRLATAVLGATSLNLLVRLHQRLVVRRLSRSLDIEPGKVVSLAIKLKRLVNPSKAAGEVPVVEEVLVRSVEFRAHFGVYVVSGEW